jgi:hypothetical protein
MSWEPSSEAKDIAIDVLCQALNADELQRVIGGLERHPGLRGQGSAGFFEAAQLLSVQERMKVQRLFAALAGAFVVDVVDLSVLTQAFIRSMED